MAEVLGATVIFQDIGALGENHLKVVPLLWCMEIGWMKRQPHFGVIKEPAFVAEMAGVCSL